MKLAITCTFALLFSIFVVYGVDLRRMLKREYHFSAFEPVGICTGANSSFTMKWEHQKSGLLGYTTIDPDESYKDFGVTIRVLKDGLQIADFFVSSNDIAPVFKCMSGFPPDSADGQQGCVLSVNYGQFKLKRGVTYTFNVETAYRLEAHKPCDPPKYRLWIAGYD